MRKIEKIKINSNPENSFTNLLELISKENEIILKIPIESLTCDIITSEFTDLVKYKKSIWEIFGEMLLEKNVDYFIIYKEINKEYFAHFLFKDKKFLELRPSDGIIVSFLFKIPIFLSNDILEDKYKEILKEVSIDEQIQEALNKEDYELAAKLKKIKTENTNDNRM